MQCNPIAWLARLLSTLLIAAAPAAALDVWPDARYADDVPTLEAVVGHDFGAEITAPADLLRYLEALAAAAPERTRLVEYARSWEGRPLVYLVIGRPEHIAALDRIRAGITRLADPRGLGAAERERLLAELPAVVWLAHGVHGDEISSPDAALLTAYHLLAATDERTRALLQQVLVIVDPLQNPDGRARFVADYRSLRGLTAQPSPIAAERSQRWPGGRTNHYLFDMNRDWFALTQPEVRGRVRAFLDYHPQVYVDLHEMDTDATYYFPPPAVPYNPHLTGEQHALLEVLGRGIADVFDRFGFRYFTRETFDAYYPGYGDTWPTLHGAVGMTFETASARGLVGQRSDGSLVRFADSVRRHVVASLATIGVAARERRRLLEAFVRLRTGPEDDRVFLLSREPDPGRADALAEVLRDQGIEVRRLPETMKLCGVRHPAGTWAVATAQPAGRLAATLLSAESPAPAEFWQEQERRAEKRLPVEVYDVVAWSLPLLYDVPVSGCRASVAGWPRLTDAAAEPAAAAPAAVGYLVPWGTRASARLLAAALRDGLRVQAATRPLRRGGRNFPTGTLIVRRSANDSDLPGRLTTLNEGIGAELQPMESSWMEQGIDLGSDRVRAVPAPQVALAWDEPTQPGSAGAWRFLLERKLGYPVAPVRVRDLDSPWLDQFDVLVLPEGERYQRVLGEDGAANLRRWIERGGTLIAVGSALAYASAIELLEARPERRAVTEAAETDAAVDGEAAGGDDKAVNEGADEEDEAGPVPGMLIADEAQYRERIRPEREPPRSVPGVLVRAAVDPDHWLGAGLPERLTFMLVGERIFTPLPLDKGTNVARFLGADELVAAGYLWRESREQLAYKPAVLVQPLGRGQLIGFAADPAFRGMMDGLDVLVANAVFLGRAAANPVPPPPAPGWSDN
ncbi:MAG TPA: M14 metallopeptidase family protein [Pseudomonadales bacterium]